MCVAADSSVVCHVLRSLTSSKVRRAAGVRLRDDDAPPGAAASGARVLDGVHAHGAHNDTRTRHTHTHTHTHTYTHPCVHTPEHYHQTPRESSIGFCVMNCCSRMCAVGGAAGAAVLHGLPRGRPQQHHHIGRRGRPCRGPLHQGLHQGARYSVWLLAKHSCSFSRLASPRFKL